MGLGLQIYISKAKKRFCRSAGLTPIIIQETHPLEGLLRYTSGACGIHTFEQLRKAIQAGNQNDENWNKALLLLQNYQEVHDNINVPFNHTIEDVNLFSWISVQRKVFRQGKLSVDRRLKLEAINGWMWNPFDKKWEDGIQALTSFYERENHVNVPPNHIEGTLSLGRWVRGRKNDYEIKRPSLTQEKQQVLESFPGRTWDSDLDVEWYKGFELLKEYVKIHKHARVPGTYVIHNYPLGNWVATQRGVYKKKKLSDERTKLLEALPGWSWDIVQDRDAAAFQALDSFVAREKHALVPTAHIENGFPLGKWVSQHRLYHAKVKLEKEFVSRLESYPGWYWDANKGYWEMGVKALLQFYKREGHTFVKDTHIENGLALGRLCQMYRYLYKQGKLDQDKLDFFNSLSSWYWDVQNAKWMLGYEYLKAYVVREGHARVPVSHKEGQFNLGVFVRTQRYAYTQNKLSPDKIQLLEAIHSWMWSTK